MSLSPATCRVTRLSYLQLFVADCMAVYPAYAIMFNERSGLSTGKISILFGIFTVVTLVSEVPTGVLADKFSRRWSVAAGYFLQAVAFVIWLAAPNFAGYAAGFAIWGFGVALYSGAFEAYLYDELKSVGDEEEFARIYGRSESFNLVGMVVSYLLAAAIGLEQYTTLLSLSIATSVLAAGLMLLFPKEQVRTTSTVESDIRPTYLRSALKEVRRSPIVMRLVVVTGLAGAFYALFDEFIPLYYKDVGASNTAVPLLFAVGMLFSATLSWWAHRFIATNPHRLLLLVATGAIVLVSASYGATAVAIFGGFVFIRAIAFAHLLFEVDLQHAMTGDTRATLGSLANLIVSVASLSLTAIYGLSSTLAGDENAPRIFCAVVLVACGSLALWWRGHTAAVSAGEAQPRPNS